MPNLDPDSYQYSLPESRIARFPLKERDQSKLLIYRKGKILHKLFRDIPEWLPPASLLVFNETKVIPARLGFYKPTGAYIEIMLLNPLSPSTEMNVIMKATGKVTWACMVRNLKKWKEVQTLKNYIFIKNREIELGINLVDRTNQHVIFTWNDSSITFSEILNASGQVPLPPYIKRDPVPEDKSRYQTIYSKNEGAVAAPTAGLHFTKKILNEIAGKGHLMEYVTLHVSAGTFQPIEEKNIKKHNMHSESIMVSRSNLRRLIDNLNHVVAVGTTSMRTIESLYWFGVQILREKNTLFFIDKLVPYKEKGYALPSTQESLNAVLSHMIDSDLDIIKGETRIFIFPGYDFKVCNGLITNFHMPGSTLMLLVAAYVGDAWRNIYDEAMEHDYRFLSYGDSSLLIP